MKIDFAKTDFDCAETDAVEQVLHMPDGLLASGPENEAFEKEFAAYVGTNYALCVNSGSSANLLALAGLSLSHRAKVITSACGFPATLNPVLHLGLKPLFVDYDLSSFNGHVDSIIRLMKDAEALMIAHTLGNPLDMPRIMKEAKKHGVHVIEDCCEAVGSKLKGKYVGTFGDIGTFSFYPAHQMTALGMGGMVVTNHHYLYNQMKSLRDWGKVSVWDSAKGGNVTDYDSSIHYHTGYTYDTIGWNFKLAEANCAFGREQLKKLDGFRKKRMENWKYLYHGLRVKMTLAPMGEEANPFGFCMLVKDRNKFGLFLESKGIRHRPFFAGNILRHPAFQHCGNPDNFPIADRLMNEGLFIGCHTKMGKDECDYIIETIHAYCSYSKL